MSQIGDALSVVGATVIGAGLLWGISKINKTIKRYNPNTRANPNKPPTRANPNKQPTTANPPSRANQTRANQTRPNQRSAITSGSSSSNSNYSYNPTKQNIGRSARSKLNIGRSARSNMRSPRSKSRVRFAHVNGRRRK